MSGFSMEKTPALNSASPPPTGTGREQHPKAEALRSPDTSYSAGMLSTLGAPSAAILAKISGGPEDPPGRIKRHAPFKCDNSPSLVPLDTKRRRLELSVSHPFRDIDRNQ